MISRLEILDTGGLFAAVPDSLSTLEDTISGAVDLCQNDTVTAPATITSIALSPAAHGSVVTTGLSVCSITYNPAFNYNGPDTFTYTITNSDGKVSNSTTVSVSVTPDNDMPTANPDNITVVTGTGLNGFPAIDFVGNDTDVDGDTLTLVPVAGFTTAGGATVVITATGISYTPRVTAPLPVAGDVDTFGYTVTDGLLTSVTLVDVTYGGVPGPTAVDDLVTIDEDSATTIVDILSNDQVDPQTTLNPASVVLGAVTGGTADLLTQIVGNVNFTPAQDFNGTATISYTVADQLGSTSTANVIITVNPVNDQPIANPDTTFTAAVGVLTTIPGPGVLTNDTDVDLLDVTPTDVLTAVGLDTTGTTGIVNLNLSGEILYTPAAGAVAGDTDSFTYTVNDNSGAVDAISLPATVTIGIVGVSGPVTADDSGVLTDEDAIVIIDVLANDTPPFAVNTVAIVSATPGTTISVDPATGAVSYQAVQDFFGVDSFTYTVNDINGVTSNPATVTISVTSVNDTPIARPDSYTVAPGAAATDLLPGLLDNDSDLETPNANLLVTNVNLTGTTGTLTIAGDVVNYTPAATAVEGDTDTFTYTAPAPGMAEDDEFQYHAVDELGAISPATAVVVITGLPQ